MIRRRRIVALGGLAVLVAVLAFVLLAGGSGGHGALPEGGSSFGVHGKGHGAHRRRQTLLDALAPVLAPPATRGASSAPREYDPGAVLGLSAERAAARLLLVGFRGVDANAALLKRLAVRDFGGVVLDRENYVSDDQFAALAGEVGVVARNARHAPPLVVAEGLDATPEQLHQMHVAMTLGPVADLAYADGPHAADGPSDDGDAAAVAVAQTVANRTAAGVASAVEHFPGEGAASAEPQQEAATVGLSIAELQRADLKPFARVAGFAPAVVMSDALYAGFDGVTPATLLPDAVVLLRSLGFRGVVVSGDLTAATAATGGSVGEAAVAALSAGCDLLWIPGDAAAQEEAYRAVARALRTGEVPAKRAGEALQRIAALQRAHPA